MSETTLPSREELLAMNGAELTELCEELRRRIIETTARNGGHMASNLGVVELTVALHRVLDTGRDRLVFDVGHQAYVHKLLTGRADSFQSLRRDGGISGFTSRSESPHDAFGAGHASTSLSAAVGLARARDAMGGDHAVVAVIGDGALTGGLAFEALNDAGQRKTPLVFIINDNEMSISKNVGALAQQLTRMRSRPGWWRMKRRVQMTLASVPWVGDALSGLLYRLKSGIKHLLLPGRLFEELGFIYLGPIDGHDLKTIESTLRRALALKQPVILHVVTQKGRGYSPAESEPERYHGVAPYEIERNGSGRVSSSKVMAESLSELAARDRRVVAITAAMRSGTGLDAFEAAHPGRVYDVGIAEAHAVTMAAGLAAGGMKPYVAMYATFFQRAADSWLHDAAIQGLPVTLLADRAGLAAADGITHHGIFDLAWLCGIPGITILSPKSPADLRRMLEYSLRASGPVYIRYAKTMTDAEPDDLPIDRWPVLRRHEAPRGALFAFGRMVERALAAHDLLLGRGIDLDVLDARCLKPMDASALEPYASIPWITLEDGVAAGGWGSTLASFRTERGGTGACFATLTLGLADRWFAHGSEDELYRSAGLDPEAIAERVHSFLEGARANG